MKKHSIDPARLARGDRFRVAGSREIFVHYDFFATSRGTITELRCYSETTGNWRTLYVGKRPTKVHGLILRPYRISKIFRSGQ